MLHLDDVQLYDLSEAGGLLFKDPGRLAREARLRAIPSARVEEGLALPAAWVDAEAGVSDADPISLSSYWLARLAPPSRDARRPRRDLAKLEAKTLLDAAEAARRLCASPQALDRLDRDGTVPSLRIEDEVRYDAELVELVARADDGEDVAAATEARRDRVRAWARFEYGEPAALPPPPATFRAAAPAPPEVESASSDAPGPDTSKRDDETSDAPKAFEIPDDLGLDAIPREPPSTLLDVDGFETVDED